MSTLLRRFSRRADQISESHASLDTDGARPQSGLFEKDIMELYKEVTHPMFKLTDLVRKPWLFSNLGIELLHAITARITRCRKEHQWGRVR